MSTCCPELAPAVPEPAGVGPGDARRRVPDRPGRGRRHREPRAVRAAVEEAAEQAADLVVLPELAQSGYVFKDVQEARSVAEHLDGPSVREWADLSRRLQLVLVAGFCERGPDGHLFNSCVLIDHGQVRATYRKAHLWDLRERVLQPRATRVRRWSTPRSGGWP